MTSNTLSPLKTLALIAASLALGVALAEAYAGLARATGEPWLGAAALHTCFAFAVVGWIRRERRHPNLLGVGSKWMYAPALLVGGGSLALGLLSSLLGSDVRGGPQARPAAIGGVQWAWILWVPVVEELFFRAGVGALFREKAGLVWGSWFSAVVFALAHASPTLANLTDGKVGLPLGPFLLGLACEALLVKTGRILPAIALHMACNATVVVFAATDARWLRWLGFLYQ